MWGARTGVGATLSVTNDSYDKNTNVRTSLGAVAVGKICTVDTVTTLATRGAANMASVSRMSPRFLGRRVSTMFASVQPSTIGANVVPATTLVHIATRELGFCSTRGVVISPIVITASNSELVRSPTITIVGGRLLPVSALMAPGVPRTTILSNVRVGSGSSVRGTTTGVRSRYNYTILLGNKRDVRSTDSLLCGRGRDF